MSRVVVVGDLVTDVVAVTAGPPAEGTDTPAVVSFSGGGSAANTAAWLARTGRPVTLVAAVGTDPAGEQRVAELEAAGVRCAVVRCAAATGTVVVIATGEERTMLCDRGANARLAPDHVDAALRNSPDAVHLHLSGYPLFDERSRPAARHALTAARAAGLSTSVDAASAGPLRHAAGFLEWVRGVDLLFANRDEARVLVGDGTPAEQASRLAATVGTAIVKLGPDGAVWARDGEVVHVPARQVPVLGATGAGDAFAAGALSVWLAGGSPDEVLDGGVRHGAEAVGRAGARPALSGTADPAGS